MKRFFGGAVIIAAMSAVSQVFALLLLPLVARIFTPESFGSYAIVISYIAIFLPLSCLRLNVAINAAGNRVISDQYCLLAFYSTVVMSVVSSLLFFVSVFFNIINLHAMPVLLISFLVGSVIFVNGLLIIVEAKLVSQKTYPTVGYTKIAKGAGTPCSQVLFGLAGMNSFGLLLGTVTGYFLAIAVGVQNKIFRSDLLSFFSVRKISKKVKLTAKSYILQSSSAQLINGLMLSLPIIYMSAIFPIADVGVYALARQITINPFTIITHSIYLVSTNFISRPRSERIAARNYVLLVVLALTILPLLVGLFIHLFGSLIVYHLLGEQWSNVATYALVLVFGYVFRISSTSLSSILELAGRSYFQVWWNTVAIIVTVAVLYFCKDEPELVYVIFALALKDLFIYSIHLILVYVSAAQLDKHRTD